MAQQPAVVIIARHGPRLDAADQQWHLTTPTPYDPPLTYGGWNQSKALGIRIASLLHAREEERAPAEPLDSPDGITVHDFAHRTTGSQSGRKRKRRHKVVIHTSPFLRCLQTSIGIAAGMAQYQPPLEKSNPSTSATSRTRTPISLRSGAGSPRLRAMETPNVASLPSILEPKEDLAHVIARRALLDRKRHRKAKLRVDAFLGEWLNPPYFEKITSPPPSAMMVATAKSELMQNETVDIFTPSVLSTKSSQGSLWGGHQKKNIEESALDEWSDVHDSLMPKSRSRSNSATSVGSNDSGAGRRSPFRPEAARHHHLTSTIPKPETTVYVPPTPQYAVSGSETIPRGYVSHAKNACTNVDFQWDSSRPPQNWPDGGEYGEEWSAMHKRFRRGINHLIHWYSQHDADDRAEDSLSLDQAERHEDEEQEDLVLILVTHGAGSNALIGALTGQPVLLDVGMASLTMAVRRDDAPPVTTYASSTAPSESNTPRTSPSPDQMSGYPGRGHARRGSLDLGLASVYEMKLVSSSEHLRPGADPTKMPSIQRQAAITNAGLSMPLRPPYTTSGADNKTHMSASLGSIRRPSGTNAPTLGNIGRIPSAPAVPQVHKLEDRDISPMPTFSGGLWTPPSGRTPILEAQDKAKAEKLKNFNQLDDGAREMSPARDQAATTAPPGSRSPPSSIGKNVTSPPTDAEATQSEPLAIAQAQAEADGHIPVNSNSVGALAAALSGTLDGASAGRPRPPEHRGSISDLKAVGPKPPHGLSRGLSQKGLWGSKPSGEKVKRAFPVEPKRRWTVNQEDGVK
ncbi:phosphoglycerate mutase family protein [Teratosphaeria destructans]|uniref:Phosphoglycerate mutase family protein n=1 Tax=Teratosphaeria destructans TaxID=418781 RepID=A0A9W7W742_9PEZI|nr:phosphoglycerate mutase family protein [Teratosphaeria destructans]